MSAWSSALCAGGSASTDPPGDHFHSLVLTYSLSLPATIHGDSRAISKRLVYKYMCCRLCHPMLYQHGHGSGAAAHAHSLHPPTALRLNPGTRNVPRKPSTSRTQGLATGYVLGELLSRLNLQPDFEHFDASGTPDAMINNYTRLQPTLRALGVKFSSNVANALIREDRGVALKVLYDIKRVRARARPTCPCPRPSIGFMRCIANITRSSILAR